MNVSSNSNQVRQLEQQFKTASQELVGARSETAINKATAKIEAIQTQINEMLSKFDAEVSTLKMDSKNSFKTYDVLSKSTWVITAQNIQKESGKILNKDNQVFERIVSAEKSGQLSQFKGVGAEKEIVRGYQRFLDAERPPLSDQQKHVILKTIIAAVHTPLIGHKEVYTDNPEKPKYLLFREEGRTIKVLKYIAEGGDSRVYAIGEKVMKVALPGKQDALNDEVRTKNYLNHQFRAINTNADRPAFTMERFKDDFNEQVRLHQALRGLGLRDRDIRGKTPQQKEEILNKRFNDPNIKISEIEKAVGMEKAALLNKLKNEYIPLDSTKRESICTQMIKQFKKMVVKEIFHNDIKPENTMWKQDSKTGRVIVEISDFGKTVHLQDRRPALAAVCNTFVFPSPYESRDLLKIADYVPKDDPKLPQLKLNQMLHLFSTAGLMERRPDGKLVPNLNQMRNFLKEMKDPSLNGVWVRAGLLENDKNTGTVRFAFSISSEDAKSLEKMLYSLKLPLGTETTPHYVDSRAEDWTEFFARAGDFNSIVAAAESGQQLALGLTLYEMMTGIKLERQENKNSNPTPLSRQDLANVERELYVLGITKETRDQIVSMLTPLPPSPSEIALKISMDINFGEDKENQKARFEAAARKYQLNPHGELPFDYVDLAVKHGFDANNLKFKPKPML